MGVADTGGLTDGEYLVLAPLEGGEPRPFSEIADDFIRRVAGTVPTMKQVAAVLGPGVISAAEDGDVLVARITAAGVRWL